MAGPCTGAWRRTSKDVIRGRTYTRTSQPSARLPKTIPVNPLDLRHLMGAQRLKLTLTSAFGERAAVLLQKTKEQIEGDRGHIHDHLNAARKCVVALQVGRLGRQVHLDRLLHALEEKLHVRGGVKVAVEVRRRVMHLDIVVRRGRPVDMGQQTRRVIICSGRRPHSAAQRSGAPRAWAQAREEGTARANASPLTRYSARQSQEVFAGAEPRVRARE